MPTVKATKEEIDGKRGEKISTQVAVKARFYELYALSGQTQRVVEYLHFFSSVLCLSLVMTKVRSF